MAIWAKSKHVKKGPRLITPILDRPSLASFRAEINAESEAQTVADTTKGPEEPLGERGADKADSLPPDGDEDTSDRPRH